MSAYYLVHTQTGEPPYEIRLYNQYGGYQGTAPSISHAQAWVTKWNRSCLPNTLAPTTCTSELTVPCKDCVQVSTGSGLAWKNPVQEKGNNPMFLDDYDCPVQCAKAAAPKNAAGAGSIASVVLNAGPDTEQDQRKYLGERAYNVRYLKREELNKQFFIYEPDGPKTPQELIDRLKAGLYTVSTKDRDGDEFEERDYFYWRDVFSWRTPTTQPDKAGCKAAMEAFEKVYLDAVDTIKIVSPADGLVALKALQDWKFVPAVK